MNHTHSLDFRGDLTAAFAVATSTLTACGFKLVNKTARSLEFTGPGGCSARESPLTGASRITFTGGAGRIELEAQLGGNRRLFAIVAGVAAIGIAEAVVFGARYFKTRGAIDWGHALPAALVPLAVGVAAGPLALLQLRRRTSRALDTLLHNMAMTGKDS